MTLASQQKNTPSAMPTTNPAVNSSLRARRCLTCSTVSGLSVSSMLSSFDASKLPAMSPEVCL